MAHNYVEGQIVKTEQFVANDGSVYVLITKVGLCKHGNFRLITTPIPVESAPVPQPTGM